MKSGVADMVNTGGRQGGAITAALFLKQVSNLPFSLSFPLQFYRQPFDLMNNEVIWPIISVNTGLTQILVILVHNTGTTESCFVVL